MLFCRLSREELSHLAPSERERERGLLTLSPAVGQQEKAVGQNVIKLYELVLHSALVKNRYTKNGFKIGFCPFLSVFK